MNHFWVSGVLAFFLSGMLIIMIRPIALKIGLVDAPGGRKTHAGQIPLIGGIAMFVSFCFACTTVDLSLLPYRALLAGGGLLVIAGIIDDFHELTPKMRLLIELGVSLLMIFCGGVVLAKFGNFFFVHSVPLGYFGVVLTVIAVISLINAKNMLDGIDGLAGGISVIELAFLSYLAMYAGRIQDLAMLLLMMTALLGFLIFNFPKTRLPKVFMGDAGSMFLGFFLTWFCVSLSQGPVAENPVTFVWVMAVPLFDFLGVFIVRLLQKRSPLSADRSHLHYRLLDAGYSPLQVNLMLYAMSAGMGLIGVAAFHYHVLGEYSLIAFIALFVIYLGWMLKRNSR